MTLADIDNAGFIYTYIINKWSYLGEPQVKVLKKFPKIKKYYE